MKTQDYNFSLSNETYAPLQNGTIWQSASQLNSDACSNEITLPNAFIIADDVYTSIRIYNNGFITFGNGLNNGQIMGANVKSPISNTVKGWAVDYVVSAFGNNLRASLSGSPEISYGENANDFVIQFQDLSINGSNQTRISFQIVLKSDSTIQFVYGNDSIGQASAVSSQIGLRGKAELVNNIYVYNDWNNRKLITGNWNTLESNSDYPNNSPGTMPSSAMAWKDTTILPQSGLTFNWTI